MDVGLSSIALTFGAGLASVASPCVLPVVPIILSGTSEDHRSRPALIVAGIAASFVAMGVITSLFGSAIGPVMPVLEKLFGAMVILFGALLLAGVNPFKRITWGQGLQAGGRGRFSGLLLGLSLGIVWIPCVGPMLSSVLALVASKGSMTNGVMLLLVYSLGFAVPMLAVGYGSQALRQRVRAVSSHPVAVRWASGLLLVTFGVVILTRGMLFAGM
ncbi:MAG: cytochrome c biogenesis CcdA family protein [Deltaproteobacteria bacterium]|nr:cytochrome c biogenesis CcdA family protein [Deltaproteobacteria bacterium]